MASLKASHLAMDMPKNYFGLLKRVLRVGAINLDGNDSIIYRCYSIFVFIFITVMYSFLDFLELFKHEFAVVAEDILMYSFSCILTTIKVSVVLLKRKKFGLLLKKLERKPFIPDINRGGVTEEEIMRECVWVSTTQARAYWITIVITISVATMFGIYKRLQSSDYHDWIFPHGPFTVLNVTYSPNYEISFLYQTISGCYFGIQFTSVDLITNSALVHICYQFKIVQLNLRHILLISYRKMKEYESGSSNCLNQEPKKRDKIEGSEIPWKHLKISLKQAVEHHIEVLKIVEEIESLLSGLLLASFLSTLVILCCLIYHISLLSIQDAKMLSTVGESMAAILQIALVCYWGEQVMFESQEVGRAAYESNFSGTDLRFQKSLMFIIRRSQNPSTITARKFTVICLVTFVWVIRASYSACMMLRGVRVDNISM